MIAVEDLADIGVDGDVPDRRSCRRLALYMEINIDIVGGQDVLVLLSKVRDRRSKSCVNWHHVVEILSSGIICDMQVFLPMER